MKYVDFNSPYADDLRVLYPDKTISTNEIAERLGVSVSVVRSHASRLGIKRSNVVSKKALPQEIQDMIRSEFEFGDIEDLARKTGKTAHAIYEWANRRGLKRKVNINRNGSLTPLLSGTLESFYWLGYLASDGYIAKNGHLMFSQGEKDKGSVYQFADYVGSSVYVFESSGGYTGKPRTTYRVNLCDKLIGLQLRQLWELPDDKPKTYSAISFDFIRTQDQALAFLVGFFDGDGYRASKTSGKIELHSNWLPFLQKLSKLCQLQRQPKLNARGFADLPLLKQDFILLEQLIIDNNLKPNARKWSYSSM